MRARIFLLAAVSVLSASATFGQFVDNGGQAGSADTSAFGQSTEFSNVTTTFDGVELQLERLIRDPKDRTKLKLIGKIVNSNSSDRWIKLFPPFPKLTDELGNEYQVEIWTGVDACRDGAKERFDWTSSFEGCTYDDGISTRLAPGLPVTIMVGFTPASAETFDVELAQLSTFVNAALSFVVSVENFDVTDQREADAKMMSHQVVVPQIPVPAE